MGNAKKSSIQIGLFTIPVRLEVAVDDDSSGTHTVCTGHGTHEPTRVKNHVDCPFPKCGESHSSVWGYTERGVEQEGKVVLLTAEEIKAAAGDPIKHMALSFHPREKVYAATVAADSVQNITPDKGGEKGYQALRNSLARHPELVGVTVWAPSTKNALWVLEVVDQRIVASKRAWPEDVRPAPAIAPAEVADYEQEMLDNTIEALGCDFDVSEYRNAAKEGMATLIASRLGEAVAVPAATGQTAVPQGDMLAALQATLAQATKKAPAKKAAAKKTAAKRVTVKAGASKRPAKKTSPKESAA